MNIVVTKIIGFITFFILARLLDPRDYGVIGIILLVQSVLENVSDPSLGLALTRMKESIESYLDPYWTFEIIRNAVLAVVIFLTAEPIGMFFHFQGPEITMLRWSGILLLILPFGNIRQLYLAKDLQFDKIFFRDIVVQTSFTLAAVCFAFFVQASAWALFFGYAVSYIASDLMTYLLYRSRSVLSFRFKRLWDLVGYSKWVYGQGLLDMFMVQFDKIIVGRLLDPASLGLYSKGKDLASTTTSIMSSIISKVGFSAFAKLQDQMDKVRTGFLMSIDVLLLGGLPVTLLLLIEGGSIVNLLLGPKWIGLVVVLKVFAFGNLFFAFVRIVNPLLSALGRPDVSFKTNLIQTIISIPLMFIGYTLYGMNGLAGALAATWIFLLMYVMLKARPVLNIPVRAFVPAIVSGSLASLAVLFIDFFGRSYVHAHETPAAIIVWIMVLGLSYFLCLALVSRYFVRGPWETLRLIWRSLLARKQSRL